MGASSEMMVLDANASKVLAEYAKVIAETKKLTAELQKGAKEAVKGSAEASAGLAAQAKAVIEATARQKELKNALAEVNKQRMAGGLAVSAAIAQLKRLEAQEQLLQKEVNQTTTAFVKSGEQSSAALDRQIAHLAAVQKQMTQLRTVIGGSGAQFGQFGHSAGQANNNITQLSFALDDFLTVAQQQDGLKGFINGLRAAGNNLSFVLASINPLYAIIPSVGTALAGLALKFFDSSEGAEKAAEGSDKYSAALLRQRDALLAAEKGEKALAKAREDREFSAELSDQRKRQGEAEQAVEDAKVKRQGFDTALDTASYFLPANIISPLRTAGAFAFGDDKGLELKAAAERKRTQKLIEERETAQAAKSKATKEEAEYESFKGTNKTVMDRAGTKYSNLSGELKRRAEVGFAQGLTEEQVVANLSPVLAAGFSGVEQEAIAPTFLKDIADAQQEVSLKPGKSADEVAASGLEQKLREIRAEKAAAIAAAPRNKLSGAQDRSFRERETGPQADLAALNAKIEAQNDKMINGIKDMNDGIKDLVKIASGRNSGRPLARDGGL